MGMFQTIASSGISSSKSSHSASRSSTVFLVPGCQDWRHEVEGVMGDTSRYVRELLRDNDLGEVENTCGCVGEGERERRPLM